MTIPGPKPCKHTQLKANFQVFNEHTTSLGVDVAKEGHVAIYAHFFNNQIIVQQEQRMTTFYDLLAGLGGNLGMFLGFSLVSSLWGCINFVCKLASEENASNDDGPKTTFGERLKTAGAAISCQANTVV